MNKFEYIDKLKNELSFLPDTEKDDALKFYEEYISDSEDEGKTIKELGSPRRLSRKILKEMKKTDKSVLIQDISEYNNHTEEKKPISPAETFNNSTDCEAEYKEYSIPQKDTFDTGYEEPQAPPPPKYTPPVSRKQPMSTTAKLLILCAVLFLSPVILGALGTVFGVVTGIVFGAVGLIVAIIAIMLTFVITGFALLVSGAIGLAFSVMSMLSGSASLIFLPLGVSLILLSLGILITHLSGIVFLKSFKCFKFIPRFIIKTGNVAGNVFNKVRGR